LRSWKLSAPMAMMLQVSAALVAFIIGAIMLWRNTPPQVRQATPISEGRVWLASSFLFTLISGFQVINRQVGTLILGLFEPSTQVGIFRVALQVSTLAAFGLQAVNMVVAPRFAKLYAQGKTAHLQRLVTGSARVVLVFNLTVTVLLLVSGKLFFSFIFGPDFAASYAPLVILLIGLVVSSAAGSVGFLLNMTGHERETARGMAVAAASNVVLNLLLVPLWGLLGAAAASAISMIIWNIILWRAVRNRLGINSLAFNFGRMRAQ
jgi:O-antigen/teichoic acid export membrane protein